MNLAATAVIANKNNNWGAVGCRQSHIRTVRAIEEADAVTIVLEDDLDIEAEITTKLPKLMSQLPKNWDMVRLGNCWERADKSNQVYPGIYKTTAYWCTHAYMINGRKAARKWLKIEDVEVPSRGVDGTMHDDPKTDFYSYTFIPVFATQIGSKGDISTSGGRYIINWKNQEQSFSLNYSRETKVKNKHSNNNGIEPPKQEITLLFKFKLKH